MLLPVTVAAADALLDALGVPGQVVVDDQRTELEVDALGGGLGGKQDVGVVLKVLDQSSTQVHALVAGGRVLALVALEPVAVNGGGTAIRVAAVDGQDAGGVVVLEETVEVVLRAARFGKDDRLTLRAQFLELGEPLLEGSQQGAALGVVRDGGGKPAVAFQFPDFGLNVGVSGVLLRWWDFVPVSSGSHSSASSSAVS